MAVKNREQVGWIHCPMCQTRATVHCCAVGRGARKDAHYWRCECGTVQPWKPQGQVFIQTNMEPMSAPAPKPAPKPTPETEAAPAQTAPETEAGGEFAFDPEAGQKTEQKPKRRGFLHALLTEE